MEGDRKRNRKEANLGKGSKASTSKDHEDTTLEAQDENKKRKYADDNGGATINPKPKEDEKPKGLHQNTPESNIYAYELPKIPPVRSNIRSLVKNNEYSTPFEKQLQASDMKERYRLNLSTKAVKKFLFPLLKAEERRDFCNQGIPVTVYDVHGKAFPMEFESRNKDHFVLTRGWARFCNEHRPRAFKDFITLWKFRHKETDELCFVIDLRTVDGLDCRIKQRPIDN